MDVESGTRWLVEEAATVERQAKRIPAAVLPKRVVEEGYVALLFFAAKIRLSSQSSKFSKQILRKGHEKSKPPFTGGLANQFAYYSVSTLAN